MQETNENAVGVKQPSALRAARETAACALLAEDRLTVAVISYLFCVLTLFALVFSFSALAFFFVPVSATGVILLAVLRCGIGVLAFLVIPPLLVGRCRMMGMIAAGKNTMLSELFHYFSVLRLWWRGIRIALLLPIAFLLPPFFAAPAYAAGNEDISLRRALALARGSVPLRTVWGFWGRALLRLLMGVMTLGLLWLLYDAHHLTATYFALIMRKESEETEI